MVSLLQLIAESVVQVPFAFQVVFLDANDLVFLLCHQKLIFPFETYPFYKGGHIDLQYLDFPLRPGGSGAAWGTMGLGWFTPPWVGVRATSIRSLPPYILTNILAMGSIGWPGAGVVVPWLLGGAAGRYPPWGHTVPGFMLLSGLPPTGS